MDKAILDIVNNLGLWHGNAYTLAALVAAAQREIDRQALVDAGYPDAAEALP